MTLHIEIYSYHNLESGMLSTKITQIEDQNDLKFLIMMTV